MERTAVSLLEGKVGVGGQILEGETFLVVQRVTLIEINVGMTATKRIENQIAGAQKLSDGGLVKIRKIDEADLTL